MNPLHHISDGVDDDGHIVRVKDGKRIGKGTYGHVYKAVYRSEIIAVKIIKASNWEHVSKEVEVMKKIGDESYHLIHYRGMCSTSDGDERLMYILMDYAENATLRNLLLDVTHHMTRDLTN